MDRQRTASASPYEETIGFSRAIRVGDRILVSGTAPATPQLLSLTLVYVAVATIIHLGIVLLASTLQPVLSSDRIRSRAGIVFGVTLVLIAIWLAVTTHRTWSVSPLQ